MNRQVHGHAERPLPHRRPITSQRLPACQWVVFERGIYSRKPWPSTWLAPEVLFETTWRGGTVYAWPLRLVQEGWVDADDLMTAFEGAWSMGPGAGSAGAASILARTARACRLLQD